MAVFVSKTITEPQLYKVQSFVGRGCRGNPAGVCVLPAAKDEAFYRNVAVKLEASETAFIVMGQETLPLRWFTSGGTEVALCGHATLASAGILWAKGYADPSKTLRFSTQSGILKANKDGENITLDFPREKLTPLNDKKIDFQKLVGFTPLFTARTSTDYFLVTASEKTVKELRPDFNEMKKIDARGFIITAQANGKAYDFVSRFFAPGIGIEEDPVTGSAHCSLGPYWGGVLKKDELTGRQVSREGGIVRVKVLKTRVLLGGRTANVALTPKQTAAILA
jgi:PhzF family phenazine biosynthesis protein